MSFNSLKSSHAQHWHGSSPRNDFFDLRFRRIPGDWGHLNYYYHVTYEEYYLPVWCDNTSRVYYLETITHNYTPVVQANLWTHFDWIRNSICRCITFKCLWSNVIIIIENEIEKDSQFFLYPLTVKYTLQMN